MKAYIAGPISGRPDYRDYFAKAEQMLTERGAKVMNPAVLPEGFGWEDYMEITLAMLRACDVIVMLPGWEESKGATIEYKTALESGKLVLLFDPSYQLKSRICTPNKNNH